MLKRLYNFLLHKLKYNLRIRGIINIDILDIYKRKLNNNLFPGDIIFLNWSSKNKSDTFPGYFWYKYGIKPNKAINRLKNEEMIRQSTNIEKLPLLTVKMLKDILKQNNLKHSGRKHYLIQLVKDNLSEDIYSDYLNFTSYSLTEKGKKALKYNELLIWSHNNSFLSESLSIENLISAIGKKDKNDFLNDVYKESKNNLYNENFHDVVMNLNDIRNIEEQIGNYSSALDIIMISTVIELSGITDAFYDDEYDTLRISVDLVDLFGIKILDDLFKKLNLSDDQKLHSIFIAYDKMVKYLPPITLFNSKQEYLRLMQYKVLNKNDEKFNKYKNYLYNKLPEKNKFKNIFDSNL